MKAILTYHSIDPSGSVISLHPDRFRSHMDILCAKGVPVLGLEDVISSDCQKGVAITFDDGFENLASVAWPVLRELGLPATVFVATDWVGRENAWDPKDAGIPRLPLMDWTTLSELARDGLRIGSHSCSHERLPRLSSQDVAIELERSRAVVAAETGIEPSSFAYPYGDYDLHVVDAVRAAGYRHGVTTELRVLRPSEPSPLTLPRLDAYYLAKPGVMERWGSPSLRRYVRFRHAARRMKSSLRSLGARS